MDGAKFAQENECLFAEGSARTGESVEEAFSKLTQTVIYKIDSGEIPEELVATAKRSQQLKEDVSSSLGGGTTQSQGCSC